MKRSADEQSVSQVLTEFTAVQEMLDRLIKDLKAYRDTWSDILTFQYDASEALANLYKPIEPVSDPEMRNVPTETPARYMQKCLGLQKLYSDLKSDLQTEVGLIETKLMRPCGEARESLKGLQGTLKHRENTKRDYERYLSRAEHARKKEVRSVKEEAALSTHESNLAQAQIDYETADDQVKQTFPPVTDAVLQLLPYILASQVMLQTTLVGQVYTVLEAYCRKVGLPAQSLPDKDILDAWGAEFTGFRREVEQGIATIAGGKAVRLPMELREEKAAGGTVTGLGLRNKVMAGGRKASGGIQGLKVRKANGDAEDDSAARPTIGSRQPSLAIQEHAYDPPDRFHDEYVPPEDLEPPAPPKPPRPSQKPTAYPGMSSGIIAMPSPSIPTSSKPRIGSGVASPYMQQAAAGAAAGGMDRMISSSVRMPSYTATPPPAYDHDGAETPPSRYLTPANGFPSSHTHQPPDYFAGASIPSARRSSTASSIASSIAGKKKPPVPMKRFASNGGPPAQYVTALFDFEGQNEGDLAFREGDRIKVVVRTGSVDDWWEGEVGGLRGVFPANYVEV